MTNQLKINVLKKYYNTYFYHNIFTIVHESWDLLRRLHQQNSLPWLCTGDFNEIVKHSEKIGGRERPQGQMQIFREVLDECGFIDIGFKGSPFTWSKHYSSGVSIWERLDRAVVSYDWFVKHPGTRVNHVDSTTSDHKILWIEQAELEVLPKKKLFRFEEMWLGDKGCGETVEGVWQIRYEELGSTRVIRKVEKCGQALTQWSKDCFGNVRIELEKKRKALVRAEKIALQRGYSDNLIQLKKEINLLMDKEERMWRQRSRTLYLKDGDRNTRFFHCRATQRRRRNLITGIKNQSNEWCTQLDQISAIFLEYYQELFSSSNPEVLVGDLDSIPQAVTMEMNKALTEEFQAWEVENALKQMAPLKAPGPDGMPPLFYQNFWELVKGDVIHDVLI